MIGLILYGEMIYRLKTNGGKLRMTFLEMISHLKRFKKIYAPDGSSIYREMTRKQKDIFAALNIPLR